MQYDKRNKQIIYTWNDFRQDAKKLMYNIISTINIERIQSIAGIAFGGLILTTIFKNTLELPTRIIFASSYHKRNQQRLKIKLGDLDKLEPIVLVVDDIVDSGKTLLSVCSYLQSKSIKHKTATLFIRKNSLIKPDYFIHETEHWVRFPWEVI